MFQLPSNAQLAFKGKIFEVWQWEQKMFDGTMETFEVLRRANTAQVISTVGDKILVQSQIQPHKNAYYVSLAGGRCEENEDPLDTAKRELLEETGYESSDWILFKEQNPVGKMIWTVYTYIARNCVYKQQPHLDSGEKIENRLITFDEFLLLADDSSFYDLEIIGVLIRARFDKSEREKLFNLLFG